MALPPLPPSNTIRLYLRYTGNQGPRTAQFRANSVAGASNIAAAVGAVINANLDEFFADCLFEGFDIALAGTNVTNPFSPFVTQGTFLLPSDNINGPRFQGLSFRSADGRKGKVGFYYLTGFSTDYRGPVIPGTFLGDLLANLNLLASNGDFVTISGERPVINPYVNYGFNAYHQRRERVV